MVKGYRIVISKIAQKDKGKIKERPILKRNAEKLIRVLEENPYQNPPSYEKLSGKYKDLYSRRINQQHRLVYKVDEDKKVVIIISVTDQEKAWMESYAKLHGVHLSESIKEAFFEKLENEYDLKVIAEYEADPDKTFYSHKEVAKELGLENDDVYMKTIFPVIFTQTENAVLIEVPDLEILTEGTDMADAIDMARDAIGLKVLCIQDNNQEIPPPSKINQIDVSAGAFACECDSIVSLVDVDFSEYRRRLDNKTVRRNVTLPNWLNAEADKANINVSRVLQDALMEKLHVSNRR
ncbi:type II toxin-antitoxin system RelB family antitoxin [Acetobacterium sp.]|uniref:type II toxin-antitoxin system RelB family antitoxin n=1 Tax=Acetobacterium sp. TaxID=1872094 RepID=UPI002F3EB6A6